MTGVGQYINKFIAGVSTMAVGVKKLEVDAGSNTGKVQAARGRGEWMRSSGGGEAVCHRSS